MKPKLLYCLIRASLLSILAIPMAIGPIQQDGFARFKQKGTQFLPFTSGGYVLVSMLLPLTGVEDPPLIWNTFAGGSGYDDHGNALAVDNFGNIYVTGQTSVAAWSCSPIPCTVRAFNSNTVYADAFVAKFDANGVLLWNTFLGAASGDSGSAIAVDDNGYVYVGGNSNSEWSCSPVPCTVRHAASGLKDFVAKLDAATGELLWNTFIDTQLSLYGTGLAVDEFGNSYVTGRSNGGWGCSPVDCTVRPFTTGSHYTENDTHVAKISPNGILLWNTFLGGSGDDFGRNIALNADGDIYVTGISGATWGAPMRAFTIGDDEYQRNPDAFVAKLNSSGELQWNTFLGGGGNEEGAYGYGGIAADHDGNAYMVADSTSPWSCAPTACTVRPYTFHATYPTDAFIAKVDTNGVLKWNTFLGCAWDDTGNGITIDESGSLYVVGTSSCSWGSPLSEHPGSWSAYVAKLNSAGVLKWNTFVGRPVSGNGVTLDNGGNVYLSGTSEYTWGNPIRAYSGSLDVFVAKLPNPLSADASLHNLVLSTGPFAPRFTASTTHYLQLVNLTVTSLTVTPRAADVSARITVNGELVASGTPSGPIHLEIGTNTITIVVTAEDGTTTRIYTISVLRSNLRFLPFLTR